ncbi:unnamed protein product, partial [Iphiclides podalirius]
MTGELSRIGGSVGLRVVGGSGLRGEGGTGDASPFPRHSPRLHSSAPSIFDMHIKPTGPITAASHSRCS